MSEREPDPEQSDLVQEKVWDVPTRLLKWGLVAAVSTAWVLGDNRSFETIDWHFYAGYTVGTLVVLRIVWGLFGAPSAWLSALFPSPIAVIGYLREMGRPEPTGWRGHAPVGAMGSLVLLLLLLATVATGLFSEDDGLFAQGPLAGLVSQTVRAELTALHHLMGRLVLAAVLLHLAAVAFYFVWKREDLLSPMISGWKSVRRRND
ncbi:MAG: cytochrome b/b6 domain-containing protein [Pseudomonadota bacterium]